MEKLYEPFTINNREKRGTSMLKKIEKDTESDSMYLYLNEKQISHSVELLRDTIILDIAKDGVVVGIELCNVSTWVSDIVKPELAPQEKIGELVYTAAA